MPLFSKPILFGCNQCGECCRQVQVPLSHADLLRLYRRFGAQPLDSWLQLHPIEREDPEAVMIAGRPVLLTLRTRLPEGGCRMLVENQCSIYADRPMVCRTFPFSRRGRGLRISPEFELLVSMSCDQVPFHGQREVKANIAVCDRDFARFRLLVKQWNQETAGQPERQSIEAFIAYLEQMEESE
ncbi:MAG: YkgJ family cysteine cluster protein [Candidatus Sericytochromatia bacterium]